MLSDTACTYESAVICGAKPPVLTSRDSDTAHRLADTRAEHIHEQETAR